MGCIRYTHNRFVAKPSVWGETFSQTPATAEVWQLHRSLPEYKPTPLHSLRSLAASLGLGQVLVKDESTRFGLKAFKGLGSTYAGYRFARRYLKQLGRSCPTASEFYRGAGFLNMGEITFCTATDGNHGRGVAWTARKLGQQAVVFMPEGTVAARVAAIEAEGAKVVVVNGNYDRAVSQCAQEAAINGWQIISDTSWNGYEEIPRWIMAGYLTMFAEIDVALGAERQIDLVLVPGGVGALAATAARYYCQSPDYHDVRLVVVEPVEAACLLESIESPSGEPVISSGRQDSIMAGLNCGTPSPVAWPLIKKGYDGFLAVDDEICREAIRQYYHPVLSDPQVVAGESGAASLAGLMTLMKEPGMKSARQVLGLSRKSTVLLLNTEGDTDPDHFRQVVASRPAGRS